MKYSSIKELPTDIRYLILKYYKSIYYIEKMIIDQFYQINRYNEYKELDILIKKYKLINNRMLVEKIIASFQYNAFILRCFKNLIQTLSPIIPFMSKGMVFLPSKVVFTFFLICSGMLSTIQERISISYLSCNVMNFSLFN